LQLGLIGGVKWTIFLGFTSSPSEFADSDFGAGNEEKIEPLVDLLSF
jgi:hypothetical protein